MAITPHSAIEIRLLRSNGTQIKRYDDPEPAEPGTKSQYIELDEAETFITKIHIPASAPLDSRCEVVRIRLFVDQKKTQESHVDRILGEPIDKILRQVAIPASIARFRQDEEDEREIVIQVTQCHRVAEAAHPHEEPAIQPLPPSPDSAGDTLILAWTFHHRTHAELQLHPLISPLLAAEWLAQIATLAPPTTSYVTQSDIEAAEAAYQASELYCRCRKIILPTGWQQVGKGLVGAISCDNEDCRVGTWHKYCVGMGDEEEPEMLWICPECRGEMSMEGSDDRPVKDRIGKRKGSIGQGEGSEGKGAVVE